MVNHAPLAAEIIDNINALLAADIDVEKTLDGANKHFSNGRRPKFWSDKEVRRALVLMHREVQLEEAREFLRQRFGDKRASSRSAIQRFWAVLDKAGKRWREPLHG